MSTGVLQTRRPSPSHSSAFMFASTQLTDTLPLRAQSLRQQAGSRATLRPRGERVHCPAAHSDARHRSLTLAAAASAEGAPASAPHSGAVKTFLEALKTLGDVRIITNNGCAVLESVTTFEGLFYSPVPGKGEYANLIKSKENIDFHLLIDKVARATLESAPGRGGDYMSHFIRVYDTKNEMAVTFYVMWPESAKRGEYAPGQVQAFEALTKSYGKEVVFTGAL